MMVIKSTALDSSQLKDVLLPRLRGRVFHVTTHAAFEKIQVDGAIRANADGSLCLRPRYGNAYFRSRNCVSFCDLRNATDAQVDTALDAYYFLNPESSGAHPAFLFLIEGLFSGLIPGSRQMEERDYKKLVVPYIEAGYPGDVPLDAICAALLVTVRHLPPDDHLKALMEFGGPRDRAC